MRFILNLEMTVFKMLINRFKRLRRILWKLWYHLLSYNPEKAKFWTFMNYGYDPLEDRQRQQYADILESLPYKLHASQRFMAQLYIKACLVHAKIDFTDKRVLEVSSGRGGGSAIVASSFPVQKYIGLDYAASSVQFAKKCFSDIPRLEFISGDCSKLPFKNNSFDIVLNLEASHCYPNLAIFFSEAHRCLEGEGYFIYCDFRPTQDVSFVKETLAALPWRMIYEEDITQQVLASLHKQTLDKRDFFKEYFPRIFQKFIHSFAGLQGTFMPKHFSNGTMKYHIWVWQK